MNCNANASVVSAIKITYLLTVAAISSEWWGDGSLGAALSGVQGHSPPEAEKKLNFDNTKPL